MTDTIDGVSEDALVFSAGPWCADDELPMEVERVFASLCNFAILRGEVKFGWDSHSIGIFTPRNARLYLERTERLEAGFVSGISGGAPGLNVSAWIPLLFEHGGGLLDPSGYNSVWGPQATEIVINGLIQGVPWDIDPISDSPTTAILESPPAADSSRKDNSPSVKPPKGGNRSRLLHRRPFRRVR